MRLCGVAAVTESIPVTESYVVPLIGEIVALFCAPDVTVIQFGVARINL